MNLTELDRVHSIYIRLSAADEDGYVTCITCGKRLHWKEAEAGHYEVRQHMATRYDDRNVHPQCHHCNSDLRGNREEYKKALIKMYGEGIIDELRQLKFTIHKISRYAKENMIKYHKNKINELIQR